jgi:hypothetical protein
MTALEKLIVDNNISIYRIIKITDKKMGSYSKIKAKIQGELPFDFAELTDLLQALSVHLKQKITAEDIGYNIKSVILK